MNISPSDKSLPNANVESSVQGIPDPPPVALVTGSGRQRVGSVVARSLAARGFSLALHYHRSAAAAAETQQELSAQGATCHSFAADVTEEGDVRRLFADVESQFGRLDVLVTTASVWNTRTLEDTTADDLLRNFQVNTLGTFLCAKEAGLLMTRQDEGGSIITIGDWAIARPYLNHAAYFVSKGAIPALTRTLAVELGHRNPRVRVNCIHPGPVMFPPGASEQERQQMTASTLVKHANCPESIAQTVSFLIDNKFITGACLPVDGGRTIYAPDSVSRDRPI